MSNGIIALLASIGISTWVYAKFSRTTGNNVKNALTATIVTGLVVFVFLLLLLNTVIPQSK